MNPFFLLRIGDGGISLPPVVVDTHDGFERRKRKRQAEAEAQRRLDAAKRQDRDDLRTLLETAVDPPAAPAAVEPPRKKRKVLSIGRAAPELLPRIAAPIELDGVALEAQRLAELDDEETLLALLGL